MFSRHGDEHDLASFFAVINALVAVVKDTGDCMRTIRVRWALLPTLSIVCALTALLPCYWMACRVDCAHGSNRRQ